MSGPSREAIEAAHAEYHDRKDRTRDSTVGGMVRDVLGVAYPVIRRDVAREIAAAVRDFADEAHAEGRPHAGQAGGEIAALIEREFAPSD